MNAKTKKSSRLTERDITDYALNELSPKERLYVESMMIGCDATRQEVCDFLELSKCSKKVSKQRQTSFRCDSMNRDATPSSRTNQIQSVRN